ncbi:PilZ domain-containing protein [Thalassobius vesicularis]|uniref:PilZ domain-containing protein n=1 Tax=Thalassobius vesicularis TaxID=1294297 RepID=A0A4V3UZ30_9RHOB|nr:PilZ domain-containing protein [Thalassobius vesicularis]THD74632.1 PilZ domain-containing protein [Thalassobius vesicularis]
MTRSTAGIALCLLLLLPTGLRAQDDCATRDWLLQVYHLAERYQQRRDSPQGAQAARDLGQVLARYPQPDVAPHMRADGLSAQTPDIEAFVRAQRSLLSGAQQADPAAYTAQIRYLISHMRCDTEPSWSETSTARSVGPLASFPRPADPGGRSELPTITASTSVIALLISAGLALLAIALRHRAEWHRRRAVRHPCALMCAVSADGVTRSGTLHDISQLGAKVQLHLPLPSGAEFVVLRSHGWQVEARIVWRNALYAGLDFRHAIPAADLAELLELNRKLHAPNAERHPMGAVPDLDLS